ncbi:MAG TPA: arginine--tRNA ligase, partial [Firmicutes bacterium]|nr:arginine--tRNA ligase [Bacillota bacterium]
MTFREQLRAIIAAALERNYPDAGSLRFDVSKPREKSFGDFATNVAMVASKPLALKPMEIAEKLAKDLESSDLIESVDVAPPGFINFVISRHAYLEKLREIITAEDDEHYGYVNLGEGKKIQVEFVSANPTGPLNIVNARAAAVGDALVRLFKRVGYDAYSEFYVNDTGTQVELLGQSLRARFAQLIGRQAEIPEGGYPGEYLVEIARRVLNLAEQAQRLDESLKRALSGKHPLGEAIGDLTNRGKCPQDVAERFVTFVQHLEPNLGSSAVSLYVCYQSRNSRSGDEIQADLAGLESL